MMAGWDVKQSLDGIDGFLSLAAASGTDLARVSDILTDTISGFGDEAKDAARYADVFAAASSSANTNVEMLGESFKMVAPVAGALGYTLEDTSLALGLMANAGIKSSQSGTSLRSALTNLVKPTKAMANTMKDLGIEVTDANGEMKPLEDLLVHLRDKFGDLDEAQKASAAATIFGKEAMSGMLAVINASDTDFNNLSKAINNSNGEAERMARTMQDNLKGSITNLKSATEEAGIKIYEALEPTFKKIVGRAQEAVDWFNSLDKSTQRLIITSGLFAASLGPTLLIGGKIVSGIGTAMTLIPQLIPLIAATAGPIALVTAALVAGGVAYAHYRQKADESLLTDKQKAEYNLELAKSQWDNIDALSKQQDLTQETIANTAEYIKTVDGLIDSYEGLSKKSKLNNDEFMEYLSLQSEMDATTLPSRLDEINERMEELRKKSGLSKEEFDNLLSSNKELSEYFPEAGQAVDEYGNAIMDTTGKLRELSRVELERKQAENYNDLIEGLSEAGRLAEQYEQNIMRQVQVEEELNDKTSQRVALQDELNEINATIEQNDLRILELQEEKIGKSYKEKHELELQVMELREQNRELDHKSGKVDKNLKAVEDTLGIHQEEYDELKKINDETSNVIDANRRNYEALKKNYEQQFNINIETGKEAEGINNAIKAREIEIGKLEAKIKKEGDSSGKIQEQVNHLKKENEQLDIAKSELDGINKTLDSQNKKTDLVTIAQRKTNAEFEKLTKEQQKNVDKSKMFQDNLEKERSKAQKVTEELKKDVDKKIQIKESETPKEFNNRWNKPISKVINFLTGNRPEVYGDGTNYHPGGPAIVGERGYELANINGRMQVLNAGLYDLPKGTKVYDHNKTKRMLSDGNQSGSTRVGSTVEKTNVFNLQAIVREEADIKRIAEELVRLEKREERFQGIK